MIVAITKTFRGHEFAVASLRSIIQHVDAVLYVHSEIGWDGREGNTVKPVIAEWKHNALPDHVRKVHEIDVDTKVQNEQYDAAVKYLADKFNEKIDWILLIDTDEVWTDDSWRSVEQWLPVTHALAGTTRMYSYIKSPFYQIYPYDGLCPVAFTRWSCVLKAPIACRGSDYNPRELIPGAVFHHYCSVRDSLSEVLAKHRASCGTESVKMVPEAEWIKDVWNKLPNATDLLPLADYRSNWQSVRVINFEDMPETVRDMDQTKAWMNYPGYVQKRKVAAKIVTGRPLPKDFGPNHPEWKITSKRNRWLLEQEGK